MCLGYFACQNTKIDSITLNKKKCQTSSKNNNQEKGLFIKNEDEKKDNRNSDKNNTEVKRN